MKIEESTYTGYLWYSDETQPCVFLDKTFALEESDESARFIIEGNLFDKERQLSVSIRYVDGHYIVKHFQLKDLGTVFDEQEYIPNRMVLEGAEKRIEKLRFRQYWQLVPDELCEGMEVLTPKALVFMGFKTI